MNELQNLLRKKQSQEVAPMIHQCKETKMYNLYPSFPSEGEIHAGISALKCSLVSLMRQKECRTIGFDGYEGVDWDNLVEPIAKLLQLDGYEVVRFSTQSILKSEREIELMVRDYLGGDDPIFGYRFPGRLEEFFDNKKVKTMKKKISSLLSKGDENTIIIVDGAGAFLFDFKLVMVYADFPKNELQFKARARAVAPLGVRLALPPKVAYKRFYFVDWPVLNRWKAQFSSKIDLIVDSQQGSQPVFLDGYSFRRSLKKMSLNFFRVRPWFESGPWGGQWCKKHIPALPEVDNYAWSFELIVPENGLLLSHKDLQLEISFDWLMFLEGESVLGKHFPIFGYDFPIRFDYLDTFSGGNLSIQCHPKPDYIKKNFGESFTQDETYYILDARPGAKVFLGFKDDISPDHFRAELEESLANNTPVKIEEFVQTHPASKHDLFLIPSGTIHGSGIDNLVLEISSTPYIFTFKLYDWLRPDLDGQPRPLNIKRGFENLDFSRRGRRVKEEHIAVPHLIEKGEGWTKYHLPTHREHFYDVHRYEFFTSIEDDTCGVAHVLNLVEGESIILETANGMSQKFNYAETFVIPASAGRYKLTNLGSIRAKVVKAFVKESPII
ncbi:MAG: class I mannose-6-phosphate isomerase [Spirochaetales bacterium]|nr:class I mannose-6-phosphate isomerase [Spirochaetales bacterium]